MLHDLPSLSRRRFSAGLVSGVATSTAILATPANAFWPSLFANALRAIGRAALGAGAIEATIQTVGVLAAQRSAQASTSMQQMHPQGSSLRPRNSYFGTFTREFAGGAGNEFGRAAARSVIEYMRGGYGGVQAEGRPYPNYPEDDVVYGAFPNSGPAENSPILGCLEIYALSSLIKLMRRDFLSFGFDEPAVVYLFGFYPTRLEQPVHHDGDWVSLRPAVFRTPGCIVEMRSVHPALDRRYVECMVRLGGSATRLYSTRVPIDPQFG